MADECIEQTLMVLEKIIQILKDARDKSISYEDLIRAVEIGRDSLLGVKEEIERKKV